MIPKKEYDFQIAVERPISGVYGDRQDQIFPEKNQYMSFDWEDVTNLVETGAKVYTATTAAQTAADQAAAAQANLQAQQAALATAQQTKTTSSGATVSSGTPKWIPWTIGGVLLIAGVVVTIVLVKK